MGRLRQLSRYFALHIAGFACMPNHCHRILRVDRERATHWKDEKVARRWASLRKVSAAYRAAVDIPLPPADGRALAAKIALWRERLRNIS